MPRYRIEIDAPDTIMTDGDLDRLADHVYDYLTKDSEPGSDNIDVHAQYN